jgi:hypothetical protein
MGCSRRPHASEPSSANCDPLRISNLDTWGSIIDAQLDERQRQRLQRNGEGLLAIGPLRIPGRVARPYHHLRHHLHRRGRISKSVCHGDRDSCADACDWHDGSGSGPDLRLPNAIAECVRNRLRGVWQPGRRHQRSGQQHVHMVAGRLQRRPHRVGDSGEPCGRLSNDADAYVWREPACRRPRRIVNAFVVIDQRDFLQRIRLLAIRGLGICQGFAHRKREIPHHLHRQRRIHDAIGVGDRQPISHLLLEKIAPVTVNAPGIVRFGGTETRALVFMDGSLYAGIGDWEDPQLENALTPGAQVLRLDSPTSSWVEDQDFNQPLPSEPTEKHYEAISVLGTAHFDHDAGKNPITPVDVLMAGVWSFSTGLEIYEKTVTTGSVGAQGTWTDVFLEPRPNHNGQVRAFGSYTDSVTHVEMAFAGSDPYGIFSGAFDSTSKSILWGATAETGSASLTASASSEANSHRVMSFASCGGKLYASAYDAIAVRTDGSNPSWHRIYQYSGPALPSQSSGFRGLTCVPKLHGSGSMLIAALESNSIDIYDIPLDGSQPAIELYTSNFLSTRLGTWVGYGIAAYNDMIVYPESGTTSCPDLLIGLSLVANGYAGAYETYYPTPSFLVRHCNGAYGFRTIIDPSITPAPPLLATRALAVSQFNGDPAGTIYSGGYDAHGEPAHNTDWIYRGIP